MFQIHWTVPSQSNTTVPIPCPDGASHTSPGCKPWESTRKKQNRVLKERRIAAASDLDPALPYAVFLQNTRNARHPLIRLPIRWKMWVSEIPDQVLEAERLIKVIRLWTHYE